MQGFYKIIWTPFSKCVILRPSNNVLPRDVAVHYLMVADEKISIKHLPVWKLYEKILFLAKRHYVRPSDVQIFRDIGACFTLVSITKTANLMDFTRTTVWRFISAYTTLEKVSSAKKSNGRKSKVTDQGRHALKRIAVPKRKTTLPQVTSEMDMGF